MLGGKGGSVEIRGGGGVKKRESPDFRSPEVGFLRRRCSKPSVWSICELVHNIVFESCRVTRTYVGVFDWLVSYTVCD